MASDQRATMSNIIAHKDVQKVYQIGDNLGMTIAGMVGDAQLMVRYIQTEVDLYKMRKGANMSVHAASTMVANVIRQGFYLGLIVGGYDRTGGHVYSIDGAGGYIEDNVLSVGSGSVFALGAMASRYKEDMSKQEGIDLAITALYSAMSRDSASGDGMLISWIDKDGYQEIPNEEIRARTAELGLKYPL